MNLSPTELNHRRERKSKSLNNIKSLSSIELKLEIFPFGKPFLHRHLASNTMNSCLANTSSSYRVCTL